MEIIFIYSALLFYCHWSFDLCFSFVFHIFDIFPYILLLFLLIYYQVENQIIVNREPTHVKFC